VQSCEQPETPRAICGQCGACKASDNLGNKQRYVVSTKRCMEEPCA
jgi:hypothetical protein